MAPPNLTLDRSASKNETRVRSELKRTSFGLSKEASPKSAFSRNSTLEIVAAAKRAPRNVAPPKDDSVRSQCPPKRAPPKSASPNSDFRIRASENSAYLKSHSDTAQALSSTGEEKRALAKDIFPALMPKKSASPPNRARSKDACPSNAHSRKLAPFSKTAFSKTARP